MSAPPQAFAFNVPSVTGAGAIKVDDKGAAGELAVKKTYSVLGGMCPRCEGTGNVSDVDLAEIYDADKSLRRGPFKVPGYSMDGWYGRIFIGSGFFDPDKPLRDYET